MLESLVPAFGPQFHEAMMRRARRCPLFEAAPRQRFFGVRPPTTERDHVRRFTRFNAVRTGAYSSSLAGLFCALFVLPIVQACGGSSRSASGTQIKQLLENTATAVNDRSDCPLRVTVREVRESQAGALVVSYRATNVTSHPVQNYLVEAFVVDEAGAAQAASSAFGPELAPSGGLDEEIDVDVSTVAAKKPRIVILVGHVQLATGEWKRERSYLESALRRVATGASR